MNAIELLKHVTANLESGSFATKNLLYSGIMSAVTRLSNIDWDNCDSYTIVPETYVINGFTVAAPETKELFCGQDYFLADPTVECFYIKATWNDSFTDGCRLDSGLVFLTMDNAIAYAKAIHGINPNKEM
jgi:hypothetical protein